MNIKTERLAADSETTKCPYSHEPNENTLQALTEINSGKGLKKAKDAEDLFKKLGLL